MWKIFSALIGGFIAGRLLAGRRLRFAPAAVTATIWVLLFLLGIEVGGDPAVRRGFASLGRTAFVLFAGSTAGSIAAAWALGSLLRRRAAKRAAAAGDPTEDGATKGTARRAERPDTPAGNAACKAKAPSGAEEAGGVSAPDASPAHAPRHPGTRAADTTGAAGGSLWETLRGSVTIIAFFAAGCLTGALELLPAAWSDSHASNYALLALMCGLGVTLGHDRSLLQRMRQLDPRLALLPLATAAGTLAGAVAAATVLRHVSSGDALAVGAGFGYYSLSSIFIADLRSVELGTVALLCNILRELFTLLFAVPVARRFGPLAAVSIGGATSMDTTLPVITRAAGEPYAVVSIFHGCMLDFSVPWLVTLFCTLP